MSFFSRIIGGGQQLPQLLGPPVQVPAGAAPVTAAPSTVFVELGEASQQAAISRNGVQVPIVNLDPAVLGTLLGQTTKVAAKVVSQSIQPGVSVAKGTTVDLVLAEPATLTVSVLKNAFQPFATQTF